MHKSPYHGFSVEFAQHREYVPGDDIRTSTGRSTADRPVLPQAVRGGDQPRLLPAARRQRVDGATARAATSRSSSTPQFVAAALAYLILQQQDAVGLATFDDQVRRFLRPSGQPSHLKEMVHVMDAAPARREDATSAPIFHDLAERFKKRGRRRRPQRPVRRRRPTSSPGLKHLRHKRHEVIVFHVLDPAELDFPFREATLFQGLEELPELLTDPRALRDGYLDEIGAFLDRAAAAAAR